jgi:hypothetical protein
MLHFKNSLPAPFPLSRYQVRSAGNDNWQVFDTKLNQWFGNACGWEAAHTIAEHMERAYARSQQQIDADDEPEEIEEYSFRSQFVTSTSGSIYPRER